MIDWARIVGFEWDAGNARKSSEKHGVVQAEAEQVFFNQPLLILPDPRHSSREMRFHALGITDGERRLHITFTLRRGAAGAALIRVISARNMHRKERQHYAQAEKDS